MKRLNFKFKVIGIFILTSVTAFSQQKAISITINDVPNTAKYQKDNFSPLLLNVLNSLKLSFTIFINEDKIYKTEMLDKNKELLEVWIKNENAII